MLAQQVRGFERRGFFALAPTISRTIRRESLCQLAGQCFCRSSSIGRESIRFAPANLVAHLLGLAEVLDAAKSRRRRKRKGWLCVANRSIADRLADWLRAGCLRQKWSGLFAAREEANKQASSSAGNPTLIGPTWFPRAVIERLFVETRKWRKSAGCHYSYGRLIEL